MTMGEALRLLGKALWTVTRSALHTVRLWLDRIDDQAGTLPARLRAALREVKGDEPPTDG